MLVYEALSVKVLEGKNHNSDAILNLYYLDFWWLSFGVKNS